jgi:hypothetical protein
LGGYVGLLQLAVQAGALRSGLFVIRYAPVTVTHANVDTKILIEIFMLDIELNRNVFSVG